MKRKERCVMQLQIASAVFMFEKWLSGDARDLVMGGEKKNALWQRELLTLHETKTSVRTGKCYLVTRRKQSWTCSCGGGCRLTQYCSQDCASASWKGYKSDCRRVNQLF